MDDAGLDQWFNMLLCTLTSLNDQRAVPKYFDFGGGPPIQQALGNAAF